MPKNTFDDESTLRQVMAWFHQAQVITWPNVDPGLCGYMASLGHSELKAFMVFMIHMNFL